MRPSGQRGAGAAGCGGPLPRWPVGDACEIRTAIKTSASGKVEKVEEVEKVKGAEK
jgi:hypothetical protein